MKKFMVIWATILILLGCLGYMLLHKHEAPDDALAHRLKIVTTIFPEYDWIREILGTDNKNVDLKLLVKNGVDLHSYQPSSEDMLAIAKADVFVYVGGHSDKWVDSALKNSENPDRIDINLFELLEDSLKALPADEDTEHCHPHHQDLDEHQHLDEEYDEHIWLSLPRTKHAVQAISEKLVQLDSTHAESYRTNTKRYLEELDALHQEYCQLTSNSRLNTMVFGDRFPFFYLVDDYGLYYYAAFTGCSADSEVSFATVSLLAQKVDQLGLNYVFTTENRNHRIAETIIENTNTKNQKILALNSLQSINEQEIASGLTYLNVMRDNLQILKTGLR